MDRPARRFQDLEVWRKAHRLVLAVYRCSQTFPPGERFGLTAQLRRAAVSVPANICEGFARSGAADKLRFMNIAHASLEETRYLLILGEDLNYAHTAELQVLLEEVSRMLTSYSRKIATNRLR